MYQRRIDKIFKNGQLIWKKLWVKIYDILKSLLIILDHFYRNLILLIIKIRNLIHNKENNLKTIFFPCFSKCFICYFKILLKSS